LAALLLSPALALAAQLGRITIDSGVGEPLRAEIAIVSVSAAEAESLEARIPSTDAYWRANIEPTPALRSIRATIERRPAGRYVVILRSSEPMLDPFMDILVELSSNTGRATREYTFLLDEAIARAPLQLATPAERSTPEPPTMSSGRITIKESRAAVAAAASAAAPRPGEYQVKPGDTLTAIAGGHRLPNVTVEQMSVALYRANEDAFLGGNMNLLKAGRVLAIPDEAAARATEPAEARRIVLEHGDAFEQQRNRLAAAVARAPAPRRPVRQQTTGSVTAEVQAAPAPKPARDQLRLSQAERAGKAGAASRNTAREDDAIAMQRALSEAQERIKLLEGNLKDVQTLLELKNQQLALLQSRLAPPAGGAGSATASELLPPTDAVPRAQANVSEVPLTRLIARTLAWMSIGAATVLLPIGTMVWLHSRNEQRREIMIRQATGRYRHKKRKRSGDDKRREGKRREHRRRDVLAL